MVEGIGDQLPTHTYTTIVLKDGVEVDRNSTQCGCDEGQDHTNTIGE